jgi:hypothetical protein
MKRIAIFGALAICLAAVPAVAQVVYDNGPINGTTDAWTVNFGFSVSNTFTVGAGDPATITGLSFGAWVFPGDVLLSAEVLIGTSEFDNSLFDGVVNFSQSNCSGNQYGFNVCTESGTFNGPNLANGTYWLSLENASVNTGDPIYWDENSGPSSASESSVGTIPSEAFTLLGSGTTTTTSQTGTVPEPSSIMLFGSSILGLAGLLRRKLF